MSTPPPKPPPFDVRHPHWDKPRPGMFARVRHRVILVRHGESQANAQLMRSGLREGQEGSPLNPALTLTGVTQAEDVARHLCKMEGVVTRIEVSPLARAHHTAVPSLVAFPDVPAVLEFDLRERWRHAACELATPAGIGHDNPAITKDTWIRPTETEEGFRQRAAGVLARWRAIGTLEKREQTLVFAHSLLIHALLCGRNPDMFFHLSNGSITVVDFDEAGAMHVHMVNYTEHLRRRSGHHTAHTATYSSPEHLK